MESTEKIYKPQYIPVKCPVCNGFGTVKFGQLECRACGGLGYVKVPPEEMDNKEVKKEGGQNDGR